MLEIFILAEFCDKLAEFGLSLGSLLVPLAVGYNVRISKLLVQFFVARFHGAKFIEEQVDGSTHRD